MVSVTCERLAGSALGSPHYAQKKLARLIFAEVMNSGLKCISNAGFDLRDAPTPFCVGLASLPQHRHMLKTEDVVRLFVYGEKGTSRHFHGAMTLRSCRVEIA